MGKIRTCEDLSVSALTDDGTRALTLSAPAQLSPGVKVEFELGADDVDLSLWIGSGLNQQSCDERICGEIETEWYAVSGKIVVTLPDEESQTPGSLELLDVKLANTNSGEATQLISVTFDALNDYC